MQRNNGPPGPARPQKHTPTKTGQSAFRYLDLYWSFFDVCRSGNCSGWPGELIPGLWESIPGPGREFGGGPGGPPELYRKTYRYCRPNVTGQTLRGLKSVIYLFIFLRPAPQTQSTQERALELVPGADFQCNLHYLFRAGAVPGAPGACHGPEIDQQPGARFIIFFPSLDLRPHLQPFRLKRKPL